MPESPADTAPACEATCAAARSTGAVTPDCPRIGKAVIAPAPAAIFFSTARRPRFSTGCKSSIRCHRRSLVWREPYATKSARKNQALSCHGRRARHSLKDYEYYANVIDFGERLSYLFASASGNRALKSAPDSPPHYSLDGWCLHGLVSGRAETEVRCVQH